MNASILITDRNHPTCKHLYFLGCEVFYSKADLVGGGILFLVSCTEIIEQAVRDKFGHTLVIHAAELPHGRGWSPHLWQILEGKSLVTVSLMEAEDKVDTGDVYTKTVMIINPDDLYDEINEKVAEATVFLIRYALKNELVGLKQSGEATYYRKRTPADSELDPNKTIAEQFNSIRVADPNRYPSFFCLHGHKYKMVVTKEKL